MNLHLDTTQSAPTIRDVVAYELDPNYCRSERSVTPSADTDFYAGDLLHDDSGAIRLAAAGEAVLAIVIGGRFIKATNTASLLTLEDGPAILKDSGIRWPSGITQLQKTAVLDAWTAKGIKVRTAVGQFI